MVATHQRVARYVVEDVVGGDNAYARLYAMVDCGQIIYLCAKYLADGLLAQAHAKYGLRRGITADDSLQQPCLVGYARTRREDYLVETLNVIKLELVVSPNGYVHIRTSFFLYVLKEVVCERVVIVNE